LTSLIDYQTDSVVSRTLLKGESGSVTVFAFDKSQSLSEHTVPHDALVHLLEGTAEIRISEVSYELKQGETILMPANQPHSVLAVERFKMALTMIRR
jgi:quercetin dioxygenase-like cupin family protein